MEEITDITTETIVPQLMHFSDVGITPKILRIDSGEILHLKKAEGPRLGLWLQQEPDIEKIIQLYVKLGVAVAYISNLYITHGHLHTENVVVEGENPIIIDWGLGSFLGIVYDNLEKKIETWMADNSSMLLETTKERLQTVGRFKLYTPIEAAYTKAFSQRMAIEPTPKALKTVNKNQTRMYGYVCDD